MTMTPRLHQGPAVQVPDNVSRMISTVVTRTRRTRLLAGALLALTLASVLLLIAMGLDWSLVLFDPAARVQLTTATTIVMAISALTCVVWAVQRRVTGLEAARQIDLQNPELQERWTSITEFSRNASSTRHQGSEAMLRRVAEEAEHLGKNVDTGNVQLGKELPLSLRYLGIAAVLWITVLALDPAKATILVRRFFSPHADITLTQLRTEKGNLVHARGDNLKLEALVTGRVLPSGELTIRKENGSEETLPLELVTGETPKFIYPLKNLQEEFSYRFRSGDSQTPWRTVDVADRPTLTKIDFRIVPPAYSKLPELHQDGLPKSVQALQGSRLILRLESNVPLKSVELKGDNETSYGRLGQLTAYQWELDLQETLAFRPFLESEHGLFNDQPPRCEIVVYQDQAPVVSVADPTNDIAVHPEDTITISFDAKDDLGVSHAELVILDGAGENAREVKSIPIPLNEKSGATSVHSEIQLALKDFELKHGQELTYAIRVYDTKKEATLQHPSAGPSQSPKEQESQASNNNPPQDSTAQPGESPSVQENDPQSKPTPKAEALAAQKNDSKDGSQKTAATPPEAPPTESPPNKKQAGGGNQWTPKSQAKADQKPKPGSEIEGKRRPDFFMAKNELDTPGGQCTSCSPRRITIDEWAGTYASQVLEKQQLQIDPVLTEMKQALTQARDTLQPVTKRVQSKSAWQTTDGVEVRKADERLTRANTAVADLTKKSEGTPYVVIGLQLQDISRLHILPARERLSGATLLDQALPETDLTASIFHIERAIELLEKLTKEYETAKLNQKLADTMTRIRKMHQIFQEGTLAMLSSKKPLLNPKQRAYLELELTDEYLQRLQELLKKKLEIQAELAKALSQDPRLLERFMARSRLEATTLRDQLTLLHNRQLKLTQEVRQGLPAEGTADGKLSLDKFRIPNREVDAAIIADDAAKMLENYITWTPKDLDVNQGDLAVFKRKGTLIASAATDLARMASDEDATSAQKSASKLYELLLDYRATLPDLLNSVEHPQLPAHITWRMQETEKLITEVSGWIRKESAMQDDKHHLAAEVDQHRLTVDTMELSRKLTSLEAQCEGISPALLKSAQALLSTLEDDLVPELEESQRHLSSNKIPTALEHQATALQHFAKAETQLDEVMDGIIKYLDSLPVNRTPTMAKDAEPESLEELLAMLEDESRAAEALGIPCCRPSNLLVEKDWTKPGSSAGSGSSPGSGSGGRMLQARGPLTQSQEASKQAGRVREKLDDSLKRLAKRSGGAESQGTARKSERAWDTLSSKLEDHIRQGRGTLPPERYRKAIEQYFETLAGQPDDSTPTP
jgi:cell fate (sporulation/competence/biofilm development) regulator YmcA (YheA/YmcA/DUF963 family)